MLVPVLNKKGADIVQEKRNIVEKHVFIFDVDGTLTESKADITDSMAGTLRTLLETYHVALLGGGGYDQLRTQCAEQIIAGVDINLTKKLLIAPVSGGSVYTRTDERQWMSIYQIEPFSSEEKQIIIESIQQSLDEIGYTPPEKTYGEVVEDRGTQITFSALGQQAPLELKKQWNETQDIRPQLQKALQTRLPDMQVRIGGSTSVDITRSNKADGVRTIGEILGISVSNMLFFGDQMQEEGNDYIVLESGIDAVSVSDPIETESILKKVIDSTSVTIQK